MSLYEIEEPGAALILENRLSQRGFIITYWIADLARPEILLLLQIKPIIEES